tara:strand:+ start:87 stop:1145 length:1059 start_codon:yes stop_codon:yes gene_type:complete
MFFFVHLFVLVLLLFSRVHFSFRWTGLVFYHSQNEIVKAVLSVLLVVINVIFFIAGLRIFWNEFAKEQEISVKSVTKALRASQMASVANLLRGSQVQRRTAQEEEAAEAGTFDVFHTSRKSLFDDGQVKSNPLLLEKKNRQQIKNRSLSGRSSVFKHRVRARNANKHRSNHGTPFGEMKTTKVHLKKMNQYNTLIVKKKANVRRSSVKKWKSAKRKLSSVAAFTAQRKQSLMTSAFELDLVDGVDQATNPTGVEMTMARKRVTYFDEEAGANYFIDEAGDSHWEVAGEEEVESESESESEEEEETSMERAGETKVVEPAVARTTRRRDTHLDEMSGDYYFVDEDGVSHWEKA